MRRPFLRAAVLSALALTLVASPAVALRDDVGASPKGKVTWEVAGGTRTTGLSADGPKSSNAYTMGPVSYVYPSGYWDMALGASSWKFSFRSAELDGAGQLRWSVALSEMNDGVLIDTGEWVYLDPFHCRTASSPSGWETANFTRTGADCAIYVSWQPEPYVGTDPVTDGLGNVTAPATSAWDALVADNRGAFVYYGFAIVDSGDSITVDRVMAGGNLLSKF